MARQQQPQAVTKIRVNGDSRQLTYFYSPRQEEHIIGDYSRGWAGKEGNVWSDYAKCCCTDACEYALLSKIYSISLSEEPPMLAALVNNIFVFLETSRLT